MVGLMTEPMWWSQRFAAEGGAAAEGISKQLGRPLMDPLTILVRESAQNSWDARLPDSVVDYRIRIATLGAQTDVWRGLLLPGPMSGRQDSSLDAALQPDRFLITISDRGTRGLGGPLRADERSPDGVVPNFVQFLRNVGEPSDQEFGGGTYGFGKGILYGVSSAHTILVDTRCLDGLGHDRRLMAASLAHSFYDADVRYTGRHWWGDCSGDVPDPVTGHQAAELAQALGLPGFDDEETGTDIVIIGADLGVEPNVDGDESPRTPRQAGQFLASSILWHLWPKLGSELRPIAMRVMIDVDGCVIDVPAPSRIPQLSGFVRALDDIHEGKASRYRRTRPPLHGGVMSIQTCASDPALGRDAGRIVGSAAAIDPPYRHIARMRAAELVVDYFEGSEHPDPLLGYAGVFAASHEADTAFAASEPPTHDDWVDRGLAPHQRGVVRGSRKFIRDTIERHLPQVAGGGATLAGLGRFAAQLAGLASASGLGAGGTARLSTGAEARDDVGVGDDHDRSSGRSDARSGAGSPRRSARPSIVRGPDVRIHDGEPMVIAHVLMPPSPRSRKLTLHPHVVLEGGGTESEPPTGAGSLEVLGWWRLNEPHWASQDASLTVAPETTEQVFGVAVGYTPDVTIRFDLVSEDL